MPPSSISWHFQTSYYWVWNFGTKFPKFRPPPKCSHVARNFRFFVFFLWIWSNFIQIHLKSVKISKKIRTKKSKIFEISVLPLPSEILVLSEIWNPGYYACNPSFFTTSTQVYLTLGDMSLVLLTSNILDWMEYLFRTSIHTSTCMFDYYFLII